MEASDLTLDPTKACLVVIDVQERLAAAMPEDTFSATLRNMERMVTGAGLLGLPVMVTEQYPRGLGPTVPQVARVLESLTKEPARLEKLDFSCMRVPDFRNWLEGSGMRQVLLVGIETHVCVYQTARDLTAAGYATFVLADAVASRAPSNWKTGLRLIERAGGVVTSTETVLFDLLGRAEGDTFKAISKLVR